VVELGVVELGSVEAVDAVDVEPSAVGVAPSWLVQPVAALSASRTIAPSAAPVLLGGGSRMRTRTQLTKVTKVTKLTKAEEA
jgi:hypothetical protein